MKQYILVTPVEQLANDFPKVVERLQEYAGVTALTIGVAGLLSAVIKSSRS